MCLIKANFFTDCIFGRFLSYDYAVSLSKLLLSDRIKSVKILLRLWFKYESSAHARRNIQPLAVLAGWIDGFGLRFNKRSAQDTNLGCANIVYAPTEKIQGLLYQLQTVSEITVDFLREIIDTAENYFKCKPITDCKRWVYVANPSVLDDSLMPATWYVEHLMAGRDFISDDYYKAIASTLVSLTTLIHGIKMDLTEHQRLTIVLNYLISFLIKLSNLFDRWSLCMSQRSQ